MLSFSEVAHGDDSAHYQARNDSAKKNDLCLYDERTQMSDASLYVDQSTNGARQGWYQSNGRCPSLLSCAFSGASWPRLSCFASNRHRRLRQDLSVDLPFELYRQPDLGRGNAHLNHADVDCFAS